MPFFMQLSTDYMQKLYHSMPRRCWSVIQRKGDKTDYWYTAIIAFLMFLVQYKFRQSLLIWSRVLRSLFPDFYICLCFGFLRSPDVIAFIHCKMNCSIVLCAVKKQF